MTRGGARVGAGRPRKNSTGKSAGPQLFYFKKRGLRRDPEDDDLVGARRYSPEQAKRVISKLVRDIRKRTTPSGGAATVTGGSDWNQSEVDYALTHSLYEDWPLVKSAVDWCIDTALENGYRVESDDERAKAICDKLGEVLKLDTVILPRWIKAIHEDGNIFEEMRWGTVEMLEGGNFTGVLQLFPIPAEQMRYKWKDTSGKEVDWGQSDPNTGVVKPLNAETLLVQAWRPDGYNPFGTPVISSILDDVETLITFQTDYRDIVKWYVKPLWHVLVGTPEKPASDTLLASVKDNWEDREPDTDLITAGNVKIEEHGIGDKMPAVDKYLEYHDNKEVDGLQSPFIHVLRNASQASAGEIRDNTFSRVVFCQRFLKREFEALFRLVLEKNNVKPKILRVVFPPLRTLTMKDKGELLIKILNPQQVQLSEETRLEAEQMLRLEFLGLPRDDTLVQTKEPQPGQQGLLGRVKNAITGKPKTEEGGGNGEKVD